MTSPYCSAFRLPRSTFSWLLRPLAQEALDAAEDRPGVASLPFLARQQRLLFGQHDEQSLGERRRHPGGPHQRSEEHTSELQSHSDLVCRLLLEKKNQYTQNYKWWMTYCHG